MIFFVSAPSGLITMDDMVLTTDQYNDMFGMGDSSGVKAAVAMSPGMNFSTLWALCTHKADQTGITSSASFGTILMGIGGLTLKNWHLVGLLIICLTTIIAWCIMEVMISQTMDSLQSKRRWISEN